MARRRAISEEQNHDERFSKLSIEAEHLWYRMLSVSDDYGVVPADPYWLSKRLNLKQPVSDDPIKYLLEIVGAQLGFQFEHGGKKFFAFKSTTFMRLQSQFIRKRTASEYLRAKAEEIEKANSGIFPDAPGMWGNFAEPAPSKE